MTIKEKIKKFIPSFLLNIYHFKLALLGAFLYGFPGKNKNIKIIGVTGTSGKSTTIDFICRILEKAGFKVASFSSVRFKIGDKEWKNELKMTMPGRMKVQKFLRQAVNEKCQFAVLEITSEGIRQSRHRFIDFDAAVFTNLSPEHVESHGGFENYRNEKLKLFKVAKNIHIMNADDKNAGCFLDIPANKKITFKIKDAQNIKTGNQIGFEFQNQKFNLNLIGEFNIYNAIAAIFVARAYDINLEVCKEALGKAKAIPGRMEIVAKNPLVVVDYAHTPEQLESAYKSLKQKSLICVLGSCGGGRDKWKRPVLGEIAKKYCKEIIITNEDPYDENPLDIINEVANTAGNKAQKILDRKEAIKTALSLAKPDEAVIITGKGSESWMCVANGKKIPWDDREIARDVLTAKTLTRLR
ncbi:MAG: UDP-N-acetylmuramoyl-L-alanyl-D-glutamate-2,6-diaminopimelate ligase [Parcubacteria group bacterium GW2011_GWA1_36_12]|nr:MAG: UDP-N-acetylmuramoyl-L-alanyl-D-glutamate-2,6-diaminopimelate ligase [Parcubacteria group bacterium GW2011_GWA1_36_12]